MKPDPVPSQPPATTPNVDIPVAVVRAQGYLTCDHHPGPPGEPAAGTYQCMSCHRWLPIPTAPTITRHPGETLDALAGRTIASWISHLALECDHQDSAIWGQTGWCCYRCGAPLHSPNLPPAAQQDHE